MVLKLKDFTKWLKRNKNNYVCTKKYDDSPEEHCPLANFFLDVKPGVYKVRITSALVVCNDKRYRLPLWARRFVYAFDREMNVTNSKRAKGATALRILREVS